MTAALRMGISTCPNDTFAFHALLMGRIDRRGLDLELELFDIEELNARLLAGELDVAKGSFAAVLDSTDELGVLPSGSALGFGNGPLLLARKPGALPGPSSRVLCPGAHTTATLLYRLFHPQGAAPEHVLFSEILPALAAGRADFGVCIHEGRFTYAQHGLTRLEDLGERWTVETGCPLPLGGLFARRTLGTGVLRRVQALVSASLEYGLAHRAETRETMHRYAQELADDVLFAHVDLYVNERTRDLGPEGRQALATLAARARESGLSTPNSAPLQVLGVPRLFHLAPEEAWRAHTQDWRGPWAPSLESEGFVHLSRAEQLAGTLALHFDSAQRLVLVELDTDAVGDQVRFEPAREGELFPHLGRGIELSDVVREWPLVRAGSEWSLPRLDEA